jgi:hypothetical protein
MKSSNRLEVVEILLYPIRGSQHNDVKTTLGQYMVSLSLRSRTVVSCPGISRPNPTLHSVGYRTQEDIYSNKAKILDDKR